MMGSELHLHLIIGEKKIIVRIPTMGISDEELDQYSDNRKVWITFPAESIHMFGKENNCNLLY